MHEEKMTRRGAYWLRPILVASSLSELKEAIEEVVVTELHFCYFFYRGCFPHLQTGPQEAVLPLRAELEEFSPNLASPGSWNGSGSQPQP